MRSAVAVRYDPRDPDGTTPRTSESVSGEIIVAEKIDHETGVQNVMPNIGLDSFIDDLSSVVFKGSNHQDREVLFHAGMKRTIQQRHSGQQQQQGNQPLAARQSIRRERERKKGTKEEGRKKGC